jgi:hypothetical protein
VDWWHDTEYATETPKFILGGVAPNFSEWAIGPGAGKGRDWNKPKGKYGIAQLSPWLLWPPDGLNLKQGTCGELFGYGYLPLPLTPAKATTVGTNIPTGRRPGQDRSLHPLADTVVSRASRVAPTLISTSNRSEYETDFPLAPEMGFNFAGHHCFSHRRLCWSVQPARSSTGADAQ